MTFDVPPPRWGVQSFLAQTAIVWLPASPSATFSPKVTETLSPLSARPATHAEPTGVQFDEVTDDTVGAVVSTVIDVEPGELTVTDPTVAVALMVCTTPLVSVPLLPLSAKPAGT